MPTTSNFPNASLTRRLAACFYESILLIAIWFVSAAGFVLLFGNAEHGVMRIFLQLFLYLVSGIYFVWCWFKSGQTLAEQTWKIKLVDSQSETLSVRHAFFRYVLASCSVLVFGIGFLWAFFDKDQLFLHDRLLKTRLIHLPLHQL
jgi:uncharacterized RDD family membrane protein YckC